MMARALELARRGEGAVEPNPMVGAVVLDRYGHVVGEGWHQRFGGPHAEVHALLQAGPSAQGGTLYVTLEPCCHHGKTPPCSDAVIRAGVRQVIVAMADPFPRVAGGGIAQLRAAGIRVDLGDHQAEAEELNAPYLHRLRTKTPWIIAKWAMSLDGRIATRTGHSQWISNSTSRATVHALRGRVDAILVGGNTVRHDDPQLTARPPGHRTPTRVVLTASGRLPDNCQLKQSASQIPVRIYTTSPGAARLSGWAEAGAQVVVASLPEALRDMAEQGWTNVLVEGGAGLLGSLADLRAIQEVWAYVAPVILGGSAAPAPVAGLGVEQVPAGLRLRPETVQLESLAGDAWIRGRIAQPTPTESNP
jgi:diaminohydroxyphosphoribosylaminopyrimidine deaminase/5-amino-6-(5-phosphoribosylamino)uracil reductase